MDLEFSDKVVINDVIGNLKKAGLTEDVISKLQELWISKLASLKSTEAVTLEEGAEDEEEGEVVIAESEASKSKKNSFQMKLKIPTKAVIRNCKQSIKSKKQKKETIIQTDGPADTSDSENDADKDDDDDDNDDDDDDDDDIDISDEDDGVEEDPLGSGDDISDEDPAELFDTENVVVCQFDKITRARNKWKFQLKDGIMNLNGRDYVFQRATGEAEW